LNRKSDRTAIGPELQSGEGRSAIGESKQSNSVARTCSLIGIVGGMLGVATATLCRFLESLTQALGEQEKSITGGT